MIEFLDGVRETVIYPEQFGIRLFMNESTSDYPVHWHTAAEIIMPIENNYTAVIADIRYELKPGDILLIPPGELHELFAPTSGKRLILQFDYSRLFHLNGLDSALAMMRPCIVLTGEQDKQLLKQLQPLLYEMMDEYFGSSLLKEAQSYSILLRFIVLLGRSLLAENRRHQPGQEPKRMKDINRFMNVCRFIREHCTENILVEDAAKEAGLSKYHFIRMFKQFTGVSFNSYLNQQRIHIAENLLIDPNLTITEVAMRSGFGSLSTFNRVFKQYKKCTPTEYKQLHGQHIHD